jgi:hypothetical protein
MWFKDFESDDAEELSMRMHSHEAFSDLKAMAKKVS